MIPADIGAELARVLSAAADRGELPAAAGSLRAEGTWRQVPAPAAGSDLPGSYATSLPFLLARLTGADPAGHAAWLARGLGDVPWIRAARPTGEGYLSVTVTSAHLAGLAPRVVAAGAAFATSDALAGERLSAPALPDLAAEPDWPHAWQSQHEALAGRLAEAAGAEVLFDMAERIPGTRSVARTGPGRVAAAVESRGLDAVRYALARTASAAPAAIERQAALPLDLANPFVLVRYAHADAASTLRWAADLGLPAADAGRPGAREARPAELRLLEAISWLPERLAAAARRRRPAELAAHLESLASAWLLSRERCPALPFGGQGAPADPVGQQARSRLVLASALRVAVAAGLGVLAVRAPARL